jgi:hypothetical protein
MQCPSFVKGALVAACLATSPSFAHVPHLSDVTPVLSARRGEAASMSGWLEVHNPTRVVLHASARGFTSPRGYSVELRGDPLRVAPGSSVRIPFSMSIRADGLYHVTIPVDLLGETGQAVGRVVGTLDLQVRDGIYLVESFENLFVRPIDRQLDEDGEELLVFRAAPPPTHIPPSDDYQREFWDVEALSVITDDAIRDITPGSEWDEAQSPTLPLPPPRDPTLPRHGEAEDSRFTQESVDERIRRALEASAMMGESEPSRMVEESLVANSQASGMTAHGSFHYTGLGGLLHPAWGWRVYAHVDIGSFTVTLKKTNVNPNGTWSMSLPTIPSGLPVRFTYEPRNVYFTLRNVAGARYVFSSGATHSSAANKVLNENKQAAYLSNSDLVGLGEVHRDGMSFWQALKTRGEGIDPVRASSIAIYYPNTSYDCGSGSGNPWSCASSSGKIWMIPAHATGGVLKHELAHQLQYKFWNGASPDGAGGAHIITNCYNSGLALSEGFANFMLVWASLERHQSPVANGFWNLERPDLTGACTDKNTNELWVAANFWDFYDSVKDSKDTIYYVHTGITPKMYLLNGKKNSMANYLNIFKSKASSHHQTIVEDIFIQNRQW